MIKYNIRIKYFLISITAAIICGLFFTVIEKKEPSKNLYKIINDRNNFFIEWQSQYIGEELFWCLNKNILKDYKSDLIKMQSRYVKKIKDTGFSFENPASINFITKLFDLQNELAIIWWQTPNPIKLPQRPKCNSGKTCEFEKYVLQEIDYINKNQMGRFYYNHEFSNELLFSLNKMKSYPRASLQQKINEAEESYLTANEINSLPPEAVKKIFQNTMDYGWNLTAIYTYELVKNQYCYEIGKTQWK